ncbi:hypothetical protein [Neptuniibacter sp.]|uniref:hypothetical protein n=1 Tax=Neptuniibacter sp. TaxID=1962643 RepID=UPI00262035E3|nr:hypothetical protein [Neptuniibacter sp.]MCP4595328.1 hypothetical protein [Neptuniibacter sp.]
MLAFNCDPLIEQVFTVGFVLSILVVIVTGFVVFSNETKPEKGKWVLLEILGPLHPLVTNRYLNEKGRKWKAYAGIAILCLVASILVLELLPSCQP